MSGLMELLKVLLPIFVPMIPTCFENCDKPASEAAEALKAGKAAMAKDASA